MNIYFIHPNLISLDSWPSLLKALNIDIVVDLLRYKSTAISPFTCNHEVFSEIDLIYNRNTLLPTDFDELSNTEQCNATKAAFRNFFAALADIGIEWYHDKEPRRKRCEITHIRQEAEEAYTQEAQEECERENEEEWSNEEDWSDWGNDELEGMNEDFPGWGWNID